MSREAKTGKVARVRRPIPTKVTRRSMSSMFLRASLRYLRLPSTLFSTSATFSALSVTFDLAFTEAVRLFKLEVVLVSLERTHGSIVNIAATNGLGGDRQFTAFNAAKGAVVNFTRGLAVELGDRGIRVNAIAPTLTVDDALANTPGVNSWLEKVATRQALAGHATPDDVAAAAAFLASDDARFITGVILPLDGGVSAFSGQAEFL